MIQFDATGELIILLLQVAFTTTGVALAACISIEVTELLEILVSNSEGNQQISPAARGASRPFVSLHVPICCEPPTVVANTLRALAAMDYEAFEVLVICNNTPDTALWEPVRSVCLQLGQRFRFYNLPELSGFKAGALNFALRRSRPDAALIGVIDADYVVRPNYLKEITPAFVDSRVGFVQCPQDYRDWECHAFSRMCYWEYWQFFAVGMVVRERRNAIMLHGTMSLIRRSALEQAGGWGEWCVTEDSELGIRLLAGGWVSAYVTKSYGCGLTPFCLSDFKRQRRRWVMGGAQQLRRYAWMLLRPGRLTLAQRFYHLRAWIPWLRDALVVAALPLVAVATLLATFLPAPSAALSPMAIGLTAVIGHHIIRQWIICRLVIGLSWRDTFRAAMCVVGLTWTVGCAWFAGSLYRAAPFHRTPKQQVAADAVRERFPPEAALGVGMAALALAMLAGLGHGQVLSYLAPLECSAVLLPSALLSRASRRMASCPRNGLALLNAVEIRPGIGSRVPGAQLEMRRWSK